MIRARMQYGAVYAKVMAMCGKMLKDEDWRRLCECKSVVEICAFLRNHKGWSETMSALPSSPSLGMLHAAVRKKAYEDCEKLYKFLPIEDKKYLRLTICRAEYDFLLDALREKGAVERLPKTIELTDFIRKNSAVDIDALEQSKNFAGVLTAAEGSIFYKPLSELKINADTGKPNYCEVGIVLENAYFKANFSFITKKYKGLGKKKLEETLGLEADLLNVVSIIRLLRNFPASIEQADELLIPISSHLKPELLYSLKAAKSESEALDLLRKSPFGKHLEGVDTSNIESLYYKSMEKFCRKLVKTAEPDIGVLQAYLVLKELECSKLNRVIEAVNSGVDPKSVV